MWPSSLEGAEEGVKSLLLPPVLLQGSRHTAMEATADQVCKAP